MQPTLKFGDLQSKRDAANFHKRSKLRDRYVTNAVSYFVRFVPNMEQWPTPDTPLCGFPLSLQKLPLGVLHEAARQLQIRKGEIQN